MTEKPRPPVTTVQNKRRAVGRGGAGGGGGGGVDVIAMGASAPPHGPQWSA